MANKELASLLLDNNIAKKQRQQGKKINAILKSEVKSSMATNMTNDLGEFRIGNILCATSGYPDDGTYTGTFISLEGFVINGETYHIGGMYQGNLMWAGNSTTGEFIFINGNAAISLDGIVGTELLRHLISQSMTGVNDILYGKLGMGTNPGGNGNPAFQLNLESEPGAELVSNGGFETGDETNWTDADSQYSVVSSSDNSVNNKTIYPYEGNYFLKISQTTSPGGDTPVTHALVSNYFNISGVNLFSARYILELVGLTLPDYTIWADFKIDFYTSASALVSTTTLAKVILSGGNSDWKLAENIVKTPATATKAKIKIEFNYNSPDILTFAPNLFVDAVSCKPLAIGNKLWIGENGVECLEGLYPTEITLHGYDVLTYNSADAAVTKYLAVDTAQYFNYVAGIANADANNGDKYIWNGWTAKAGTYTLTYLGRRGTSLGKFDVYIDDVLVSGASTDTYGAAANNKEYTVANLDIAYGGVHKLELRINGKNASSSDYTLIITKLNLRRTGD